MFNEDIENYLRALYREATAVWLGKEKQERMAGQHGNENYRRSLNIFAPMLNSGKRSIRAWRRPKPQDLTRSI
jgi:hypothetical protein